MLLVYVQKMWVFRRWEGYKASNGLDSNKNKPLFQVRKNCKVNLGKDFSCKVTLKYENNQASYYRLEGSDGKSALTIIDGQGGVLAEVSLFCRLIYHMLVYIHVFI